MGLANGGSVRIEINGNQPDNQPYGIDLNTTDNRILALAYALMNHGQTPVILVTKDLNLRIKADVLGLAAEDFYSDKVDYHQLYSGVTELYLSVEEIDRFYREGYLDYPGRRSSAPPVLYPQIGRIVVKIGPGPILPAPAP